MEMKLNGKTYKCGKINRNKGKIYDEALKKIMKKAEKEQPFDDEDLDLMEETIVKLYDNQFTQEDIQEHLGIDETMFHFMEVQFDIQGGLNNRIEQKKRAFQKGK